MNQTAKLEKLFRKRPFLTGMALLERNRHACGYGIWLMIEDGNLLLQMHSDLSWTIVFLYLEEITEVQIKDIRHLACH